MKVSEFLEQNPDACEDAKDWLRKNNIEELRDAWEICPRGDWMWWALRRMGVKKSISVKFSRFCANRAKKHAAYAAAAYAAADDAAYAAYAAAAAAAAADAYAAAAAAAAAADADAHAYASDADAERQAQADWLREHVKNPFLNGGKS